MCSWLSVPSCLLFLFPARGQTKTHSYSEGDERALQVSFAGVFEDDCGFVSVGTMLLPSQTLQSLGSSFSKNREEMRMTPTGMDLKQSF